MYILYVSKVYATRNYSLREFPQTLGILCELIDVRFMTRYVSGNLFFFPFLKILYRIYCILYRYEDLRSTNDSSFVSYSTIQTLSLFLFHLLFLLRKTIYLLIFPQYFYSCTFRVHIRYSRHSLPTQSVVTVVFAKQHVKFVQNFCHFRLKTVQSRPESSRLKS